MNRRDLLKTIPFVGYVFTRMATGNNSGKNKERQGSGNSNVAKKPEKVYLKAVEMNKNKACFNNETAVELRDYEGDRTGGFFDNRFIKEGGLEVTVVQEKEDLVMVKLPGRTLEAPGDKGYMTVNKRQLEYAA